MKVPLYQLNHFHGRIGFIINGRQIITKKIPTKSEYFIDKHLGMFEIDPSKHFMMGKAEVYFFDIRNQNSFDPTVGNKLYQWADQQGLYEIRRADIKHGVRLRTMNEEKKKNPLMDLADQLNQEKRDVRRFINKVIQKINDENEAVKKRQEKELGDPNSDEYHTTDEDETNLLIIKNLFDNGYMDENQKYNLEWALKKKEIKTTEELIKKVDSFTDLLVSQPVTHEMERFLNDFHTYKPHNVIMHISALHKIRNGINKLRTKTVINFFPSMYILFGFLGVGILYILWTQYGGQVDLGSVLPGT